MNNDDLNKNSISESDNENAQAQDFPVENISPSLLEEPTFLQKLTVSISERHTLGGIILYLLFFANLIGITIFARKSALGLTQSLLYKFHIDSVSFDSMTFLEVTVLVSYILAFIFGGFLIFAFLKIGSEIAKGAELLYSHKITRFLIAAFIVLYLIISFIFMLLGNGLLSVSVCNWFMPMLAFLGGLCMYCISLRNVNIY